MGAGAGYFMHLAVPSFTGDDLGFGENPGQGSDGKQGWHSFLGCLIPKRVLFTPMLHW